MEFPDWVKGPTSCATRTWSVSLPIKPGESQAVRNKYPTKIVTSLPNQPTLLARNKETGKLLTVWATTIDPRWEIVEE